MEPAAGCSEEQPPKDPNKKVEEPATAPEAITPFMNARLEDLLLRIDARVSSPGADGLPGKKVTGSCIELPPAGVDFRFLFIRALFVEHQLILAVLDSLEEGADRLDSGDKIDADFFLDAAEFIADFADSCHHGKEEDILFVAMTAMDMP